MHLLRSPIIFILALVASTGISFVGYRYLALANQYREANFEHLASVYGAIDLIRQRPVPTNSDVRQFIRYIKHANAQALWCTENLGAIERQMFYVLGAGEAFQICRDALVTGNATIEKLDRLATDGERKRSMIESLIMYSDIIRKIEQLRDQSVSFQPFVTNIQAKLEVFVSLGTVAFSALLVMLSASVARQLTRAHRRIEDQSVTDPLTGLLNRRGFDLSMSHVGRDDEVILARVDLDRFKQVNDILGHEAGDFVLVHVAELLRRHTSAGDVRARVGGDEFVIVFEPGTLLDRAKATIQAILDDMSEPLQYGEKQCLYGASFGLASSEMHGLPPAELLNAADKALYEVKRSGRGGVSIYSQGMHKEAVKERALADRFKDALENGEIVPYFHTQHLSSDWSLFGVEVLARWNHPTEGVLTPDRFLGIASQLGMEPDLDRVIFNRTVDIVEQMDARGLRIPRVAFNVSAGRIMDPTFLSSIRARIPRNREKFAFEILESVSYENSGEHLSFAVDAIKDMGFQIDVDDFGSGHASINSVLNIEPHALKIDRDIVRPIAESPRAHRMTASIVELANALNMDVIAEGVDTEVKADLLAQMGCNALQGFFFSKPMPATDLEHFLQPDAQLKVTSS